MMLHKGKDLLIDKDGYNLFHATNLKENVRLLYVGVTRAKQYLVTTTVKCLNSRVAHKVNRGVEWFASALNSVNLVQYNEAEKCLKITVIEDNNDKVIAVPAIECYLQNSVADGRPGKVCVLSPDCDKKEYQPLYLQSSKLKFSGNVELGEIVEFGSRADVSGKDNSKVGDCIHHFMQLYGSDREKNIGLLDDLAESYGVEIESAAIEDNAEKFFDMMDEKFGPVQGQLRESPFTMDWKGNVVTGEIDLVYSTADGDVIVDYKSFAGKISNLLDKDNDHWVGKYAGQLDAYRNALKLHGRNVKAMWICYISLGVMVEVKIG
jgi:ATP-dependent exoDNAse (exonuclease V) beta subunit